MQVIEAQSFWSWRLTITCISTRSGRALVYGPAVGRPTAVLLAVGRDRPGVRDRPCTGLCQDRLVAASYCSTTLAGMRPRSLTVMPGFRPGPDTAAAVAARNVRPRRRRCPRPVLRAWSMKGASCLRNAGAFLLLRSISYQRRRARSAPSLLPGRHRDRLLVRRLPSVPSWPPWLRSAICTVQDQLSCRGNRNAAGYAAIVTARRMAGSSPRWPVSNTAL